MTTAMQIGEAARDRADSRRCFKTGAAVFLHDDGIGAHSTYPFVRPAGSDPPDSRTLSPCDPIFFHHTAILWTRLHGVLVAGRPDGIADRRLRMTLGDASEFHAHAKAPRCPDRTRR